MTTLTPPIGYVELVRRNPNFRYIWLGQIVSLLGDWFNLIASASLITSLTESGLAVGGLFVVRMLAPFLISPLAGVVADRYNRKHVLILADVGRAMVVMGFLLVRDPAHVWLLYVLTALQLGISGFFFPARNAILPDLVTRRELGTANALSASTWSVMLAFGAALGGLVAGQWGAYPSFVIDSLTFVGSALLIGRVAYRFVPDAEADTSLRAAGREYLDGLRYLRHHPDVFAIALHKMASALFVSGAFEVLQVGLAEDVYVIGKNGGISLGLIYAVIGVGTGVGPLWVRRFTGDDYRLQRIALAAAYGIMALGLAIMATLVSFPVVLAGALIRGVGGGMMWVFSTQLLLQLLPDRVRGRVFSTEFAMSTLGYAVSASTGGALLQSSSVGYSDLLWLMAGLVLIPGVLWTLCIMRPHPTPAVDETAR